MTVAKNTLVGGCVVSLLCTLNMAMERDAESFSYFMERRDRIENEEERYLRPLAAARAVISADARMKGCRIIFERRKRKFVALVPMGAKQLVRLTLDDDETDEQFMR